ncbi:radical SAM protein [Saccharopolyspora indica]|uniref:B12-binding domain-containing radical SAM protein n=1 Tax=Saccharopolyspora indica TaxID=1229659 RepID=UPI0022EA2B1B|nr:cobalamin-dependent protein [Saccharopolyspora indica]MDA3644329.1 radical SAM protein [Saccharopolyspora indica]
MRALRLSPRDRLAHALAHVTTTLPAAGSAVWSTPLANPDHIHAALREHVDGRTVVVTGTLDRRLALIEHEPGNAVTSCWTVADLSGQPHSTRVWPAWTAEHMTISDSDSWLATAEITREGRHRLLRPRLLLASLYHPENFPLPRFPLAISDLARAARATLLGQVELMDMQLGVSMEDILARVATGGIDIVGISATFGQHDLMAHLLDEITSAQRPPMVVAGGSLTARNEQFLLERYPELIIGRGAGEPTIADVLAHWHNDLAVSHIRGAGYTGAARGKGTLSIGARRRSATVANRLQTDIWPELDLLDKTFAHNGVAQLESSRGCTNFCSFCPRGHKGQWSGAEPDALPWLLKEIGAIADQHPHAGRILYLVDEEFIGRGPDAESRALKVADTLHQAGFAWETSCRVDQAVRLDQGRDWHIQRGHLWRGLVDRGLRRCLFGVESGVTSILERFNKETTSAQNVLAIRTLTALGVPPRFTYITFDQLMTLFELQQTYAFQGRTDLLMRPQPELSVEEIVDGVRDQNWVAEHTTGLPFYTGISYMLVSMECLIGAAYTRKAEASRLTGAVDPSMGRVHARFADWRIGVASQWAQLWIDRNFAFDYTLKSMEKILQGRPYELVRELRRSIKTAAYQLLGALIDAAAATDLRPHRPEELTSRCAALAEEFLAALAAELETALGPVSDGLPDRHRQLLHREHDRWAEPTTWRLINAADPCGT